MGKAELANRTGAMLGEGALWDERLSRLLWVNIPCGEIHSFRPDTGEDRLVYSGGQAIGTVVERERGGLVAALADGFHFVDEATGKNEKICDPEQDKPQNRFNDGKCDPAGRLWAGTMGAGKATPGAGCLYRLDGDLTCRKMVEGVTVSNGIAWSPCGKTMYYVDTPTGVVWAFDYDCGTGEITNRRTAIKIAAGEGGPDGITADAEGMLWVAQWGGWQACRYNPRTGRKLTKVDVPAAHVSSVALGGGGLNELYITTARAGLSAGQLEAQPLAGSLFVVKVDSPGMAPNRFKG